MFQGRFKGVSRKIEGSSESPLRVIKWRFKVCKRSSRGCFKAVSKIFQGRFMGFKESVKCVS